MQLTFEHVSHVYQMGSIVQAIAMDDINFTITSGEFVALIGHTGSGKSTLAQHMNGLLKPTSGKILFDGEDIHEKKDKRSVRENIGLVFQYPEHQLFEETVAKDVAFGPKNLKLEKKEIDERVKEAIELVGLNFESVQDKSPFELSGGQMRRVAMAGVLAMRPDMLILDEPTAGLDPMGREEILDMIVSLHKKGVTIVLISHSMDDVARVAERLIVLKNGKIVMDDKTVDVFARGEEMLSLGLDVPEACKLSLALQKEGYKIPMCYQLETLQEKLYQLLKEGKSC